MRRLFTRLASATSAWRRVLSLLWQTQPWFVMGLLVLTYARLFHLQASGYLESATLPLSPVLVPEADGEIEQISAD